MRVTEIFRSLQGESGLVGWPTVFVRLTGCPLRCGYCDSAYAFHGGREMPLQAVLDAVAAFRTRHVCVTGGEPLAQKQCLALLERLCESGHTVSLETSGAVDISGVDARVIRVLDIKTPGSGEAARNRWDNLDCLRPQDQIKFVVCDRRDFDWALDTVRERRLSDRCEVFLSPSHEQLAADELADWLLASGQELRLQLQQHKLLWGNRPGV